MKKFTILLVSAFIAIMPLFTCNTFVFADFDSPDAGTWSPVVTNEETVAAWKAYLASRNISYNGNPISALVSWSYDDIDSKLNELGYNMTTLQSGLWYSLERYSQGPVNPLRFMYNASAISILNSLFAKYAAQNGFSDTDDSTFTKTLKDGEYFTDNDGNGCFVFFVNSVSGSLLSQSEFNSKVSVLGSRYRFSGQYFYNTMADNQSDTYTINIDNNTSYQYKITKKDYSGSNCVFLTATNDSYYDFTRTLYINNNSSSGPQQFTFNNGYLSIFKYQNTYRLGSYCRVYDRRDIEYEYCFYTPIVISGGNVNNAAISIGSDGLKAGIKEMAKGAVISVAKKGLNEGYETIQQFLGDDDTSDTEEEPTDENGNVTNNNIFFIGGINANGNINFEMPDLNNITPKPINNLPSHFLLHGLTQKFPFCIPFDLIAIYEFLDTTPEAPRIQQTIDFGIFNYNLDINLNTYDSAMVNIRKFFVILYIFGLLFVTPQLLK